MPAMALAQPLRLMQAPSATRWFAKYNQAVLAAEYIDAGRFDKLVASIYRPGVRVLEGVTELA
jgi:hypothetical protein